MSRFDKNHTARPFSPFSWSGSFRNLAAFAAVAFFCSVVGAKLMSKLVDSDEFSRLAYERSMRNVARNLEQPPAQVYSVVRSVGVDGVTTATIPLPAPAPVSPCGDAQQPKR